MTTTKTQQYTGAIPAPVLPEKPLTPKQVLALLDLKSTRSLRTLEKAGKLTPRRLNQRIFRYDAGEVRRLLGAA